MLLHNTIMTKTFEIKDPVVQMKILTIEGEDITFSSVR